VRSAGGLAAGLRGCHERLDGLWIGWPGDVSGLARGKRAELDRLLADQRIAAVHLTREEVKQSYEGFSNAVIWPLFHYMLDRIPLDSRDWDAYRRVNERFADAIVQHYQPGDLLWVHDYQLMLVPGLLRARLPDARIGFFLHIPFPAFEVFRTLPWRAEILGGLLGADLIGFHTYAYVRYFTRALLHLLGIESQLDRLHVDGREVQIRAFPMGIDTERFERLAEEPRVAEELEIIRRGAGGRQIVLGVDRLDYTKGIPRRLLAFDRLLEREPRLREKVRLIQVAVPSRVGVEPYQVFRRQLDELVGRINGAWGTPSDAPVHYLYRSIPVHQLVALYRAADVMLVTALRDGMNLVAKEFVASRIDNDGVLVLSEFAGAAAELGEALLINPYDIEGMAETIAKALRMPRENRSARMRALRHRIGQWTVHRWTAAFLHQLQRQPRPTPVAPTAPPLADGPALLDRVREAKHLVLLLDYDGTLVPLERSPELARPDDPLLVLLQDLIGACCRINLVSGRSRDTLETWFGELPAALWAEHGAWHRSGPGHEWQSMAPAATDWMDQVRPVLEQFTACTPGALIEQKAASIAWHYRVADPEFAQKQALELRLLLEEAVRNQPLEVLEGSKVIEVRYRGVNKANVVERILRSEGPSALMVAFGDDRTDEEMFAALPPDQVSIRVGQGPSSAQFRLAEPAAVRALLYSVAKERRCPET
jgi:trehalose 6-phosphate synthase/phosphatase